MSLSLLGGLNCVKPLDGGPETTIALVGRLSRTDIRRVCERAGELLRAGPKVLVCDAAELVAPDAVAVDAIARLQLIACRSGGGLELRNACSELLHLLDLAGLADVIKVSTD